MVGVGDGGEGRVRRGVARSDAEAWPVHRSDLEYDVLDETVAQQAGHASDDGRAFGVGRAIVVGPSAAKRGLGFAIEQFEKVLRKKGAGDALPEIDKGNSSVGEACDGPAACVAAAGGRELFAVGPEPTLPSAQPLSERLRRRVGMFGGLGG